jgi:hypothetical protein
MNKFIARTLCAIALVATPSAVSGAERLCDPAHEDCRAILLELIRSENTAIDVAFWFMEDGRYSAELVKKAHAGVPVRVLVDPRSSESSPVNAQILAQLSLAGIPMRKRSASGILHWKMMLFAGQGVVQFSGANYSPDAFRPGEPYSNYVDEAIFFSDSVSIVQSFMRKYDDLWTDTAAYADYANAPASLRRRYPLHSIDPALNFAPAESYRKRALASYRAEPAAIDVIMYRITDRAHTDAIIEAVRRGVRVRLITEQQEYRNPERPWHSWNVDRLHMAGVEVRHRGHQGLNHQKSVLLHGRGMVIFGSSNWTSPSAVRQEEHNYFATAGWIVQWFQTQFERKWNNLAGPVETQPFTPLPPAAPVYDSPSFGAVNVPLSTSLRFDAGEFAHLYDIYLGTTPDPPLVAQNIELGPTEHRSRPRQYDLPLLAPQTTYYWRVVARTMAGRDSAGPLWSFTTGTAVAPPSPEPTPPPAPEPSPTPAPAAPPPTSCTTPDPFVSIGGGVCVGGGWVPAGLPSPGGVPPSPPAPPAAGGPGTTISCVTPAPAPSWVCVSGGWLPSSHPLASGGTTTPPPAGPGTAGSPGPSTCTIPDPFTSIGGGVCINGGWRPRGG